MIARVCLDCGHGGHDPGAIGPEGLTEAAAVLQIGKYVRRGLIDRQIEVRSDPTGAADEPQYATTTICKPGGELPLVLDGTEVGRLKVNDLLP